ncbi:uncharacterized protein KY384_006400 [Bacidia gigantensis]|uniref:uncharacterized protein n=1 Tax=Bacidia gigantensis TaxID=2732470 RepID=UPI001D049C2B|nr:uncharacterized protein KY384_006400 [Bacidia gigantensis]KAG8528713.1 hypothetical protein KY384_006400 [Bacidia gigantensis]
MTESTRTTVTGDVDSLNPCGIRIAGIKWISVAGAKYKVWTKKMGSGSLKVLLLHGGPGFPHDYLECFESFLPEAGIEMYYYDQLGCGNSDKPEDSSLWNLERYLEEVEEVRKGLGLTDFILLGHSWGGILTMEYALKHQNDGHLKAIVVSNMVASIESFLRRVNEWKDTLPPDLLQKVNQIEAAGDWENPEYERIMMDEIYPTVICRNTPWPEPVTRSFRLVNQDIYVQMQGHSEFVVTGNMKGWDVWDSLPNIRLKSLIIGAEYDEMDPEDCKKMAQIIPNGEVVVCPGGSHMCFYDAQDHYFKYLLAFLQSLS